MSNAPKTLSVPALANPSAMTGTQLTSQPVLLGRELEMRIPKSPAAGNRFHQSSHEQGGVLGQKALTEAFKMKADVVTVDGNIYRFWAFKRFGSKKVDGVSLLEVPESSVSSFMHTCGLLCVVIIQCIGPMSIFLVQLSTLREDVDFQGWERYAKITWQQWLVVILAWCFLFCFILNACYSIDSDMKSSAKCYAIAKGLALIGEPVRSYLLVVDALVNCQCAVVCSLAMFSLMMGQSTAQDVMLDALGIAFLLNIDDVASELGFLGHIWDPLKVGTFYKQLKDARVFEHVSAADAQEEADEDQSIDDEELGQHAETRRRAREQRQAGQRSLFASAAVRIRFASIKANRILTWQIFWLTRLILGILLLVAIPAPVFLVSAAVSKKHG